MDGGDDWVRGCSRGMGWMVDRRLVTIGRAVDSFRILSFHHLKCHILGSLAINTVGLCLSVLIAWKSGSFALGINMNICVIAIQVSQEF